MGRDVESMIRDLVEIAVKMVREEREAEVREKARQAAEERLLDLLLPPAPSSSFGETSTEAGMAHDHASATREKLREQLRDGPARREDGRDRRARPFDAVVRDHLGLVGRGDWRQPARHAAGRFCRARPAAGGCRCPTRSTSSRKRKRRSSSTWTAWPSPRSTRVEQAGIIFVDEIDKIAGREGSPWARREPRRRPARHPAHRRGDDRQHQVRDGADRSHPVHCRRRLSRLEAVRSDSRAPGPVSDPRRARGAGPRRVRPDPHRAEERAHQAVHGAPGDRGRGAGVHARGRRAPRGAGDGTSTNGPRTSAHGGSTRSWNGCSTSCRSTRPSWGGRSITIDAAYVDRMLSDIAKSDDLSRYIL